MSTPPDVTVAEQSRASGTQEEANNVEVEHEDLVPARGPSVADEKPSDDILFKLYTENTTHARHHEVMRQQVTNIVLVASGLLLAFTSRKDSFTIIDAAPPALVIVLGLLGMVTTSKHYERARLQLQRASQFREALPGGKWIRSIKGKADATHKTTYPRFSSVRLNWLWLGFHAMVMVIGALVTWMVLAKAK